MRTLRVMAGPHLHVRQARCLTTMLQPRFLTAGIMAGGLLGTHILGQHSTQRIAWGQQCAGDLL